MSAKSAVAAEALQEFPLQFTINNGIITEIRPALKERQKEILNIKRGILSSLQVRWSKKRTVYEVRSAMFPMFAFVCELNSLFAATVFAYVHMLCHQFAMYGL